MLEENRVYINEATTISQSGDHFVKGQYTNLESLRNNWNQSVEQYGLANNLERASWLLAIQSAIFDKNLKKILKEIESKKNGSLANCNPNEHVVFFTGNDPEAVKLWETIVRETFPLHVFNLDPITEEQNAYDAFSRRREMQVALAFSVAKGSVFSADQKLKMSRKLALDEATIALNRTAVAFAHGEDTFGWYFHPRIQTPRTESTNIGALARTIWSTGPTEHYDRKHRRLEPGIRECEVLIAMPSFVNEVSFDVTTNWEKIARPGVTKRSYEEMLAQGSRLHRLRMCMQDPQNQQCYRPGDYDRLRSRIDQLETMLGMQTYDVNLPYQSEQTGSGLFDAGKKQLRPSLDYYYGLSYLDPAAGAPGTADFFVTGKNFHPTQTHVIVGGAEVHLVGSSSAEVEVINRELIRVRVGTLNTKLSEGGQFEVRVSTPAGMSNPLVIGKQATQTTAQSEYDWKSPTKYTGYLCKTGMPSTISVHVNEMSTGGKLLIKPNFSVTVPNSGKLSLALKVKFKSGAEKPLPEMKDLTVTANAVLTDEFLIKLQASVGDPTDGILLTEEQEGVITCSAYFFPDAWSPVAFATPLTIELKPILSRLPSCPAEEVKPSLRQSCY